MSFTFDGTHCSTFGLVANTKRSLLPALRKRELTIPGKHGSYNFSDNKYENRQIEVNVKYKSGSMASLRASARNIAAWLSSTGDYLRLIFDDEPDKYYLAKLYSEIGLQTLIHTGEATLLFECEPFAYALNENVFTVDITQNNQEFTVTNNGTFETPQVITIVNTGNTAVNGFTLIKKEIV